MAIGAEGRCGGPLDPEPGKDDGVTVGVVWLLAHVLPDRLEP